MPQSSIPDNDPILQRMKALSGSAAAPPPTRTPSDRTLGQRLHDVVMGSPEAGDTLVGRLFSDTPPPPTSPQNAFTLPIVRFEAATDEPGLISGAAKFASEMTSPVNLALGGLVGGAIKPIATKLVGKLIMAGFGTDMIRRAAEKVPDFKAALDAGDEGKAKEILAGGLLEAGMGAFAFKGALARDTVPPAVRESALTARQARAKAIGGDDKSQFLSKYFDSAQPSLDLTKLGKLAPEVDPYKAQRMYVAHGYKIQKGHDELRSIAMPLKEAGLLDGWKKMIEIERHQELAGRKNIEDYKLPGGESLASAEARMKTIRDNAGPEGRALMDQQAVRFRNLADNMFEEFRDSGLISNEAHAAAKADNQRYVPFLRLKFLADEDALNQIPVGGRSMIVRKQGVVYPIKGSELEIVDPLEGMILNLHRMTATAAKNRVMRKFGDLAERPEWKDVVRPLGQGEEIKLGEGKISLFDDGVKKEFAVPKPVQESLAGMGTRELELWEKVAQATNSSIRSGSTVYYLPFFLKNVVRDIRTANLRFPGLFTPLDWMKGFASTALRTKDFDEYMRSGGAMSGFFERDPNLSTTLSRITESSTRRGIREYNPLALMRKASEVIELTPRVGAYQKLVARGVTPTEAAWTGRNLTVDFNRIGSHTRVLNQLIPFFNARVQGSANIFSAIRDNPLKASSIITATTILPAYMIYAHNVTEHKATFDKLSDYDKQNFFNVIYGDEVDDKGSPTQVWRWAKADYDRWVANPLEGFWDYMLRDKPARFGEMLANTLSDISPIGFVRNGKLSGGVLGTQIMPPVLSTGAEMIGNSNWYSGGPIEPPGSERAAIETRFPASMETFPVGRFLIEAGRLTSKVGVSPAMLQHLIQRMGGGVGRVLTTPSESGGLTKEALVDQTGMGQAGKLFVGSRGGGEEERLKREMAPFEEQASTESWLRRKDADRFMLKVKKLAPEEKADKLFQAYEDEKLGEPAALDALREITAEQMGLKPRERFLLYAGDTAVALYLMSKPEGERDRLIEDWYGRGLMKPGAFDEMGRISYEQEAKAEVAPAARRTPPPARSTVPKNLNLNERNNNPLNLRDADGTFRTYATADEGWRAGISDLRLKLTGKSRYIKTTEPMENLFEVWATAKEPGNDPSAYAEYVSTRLGVSRKTPVGALEPRLEELAGAMAELEGWRLGGPPAGARVRTADRDEIMERMIQLAGRK